MEKTMQELDKMSKDDAIELINSAIRSIQEAADNETFDDTVMIGGVLYTIPVTKGAMK